MDDLLSKITTSQVKASFFRILFGTNREEVHLREIQRRSGLAIETVRKEAVNLVRLGLIIKRKDGNRTYYKANIDHLLYQEIYQMVAKTSGFIQILKDSLVHDKIFFAFIFGSMTTGNLSQDSDVDLFILGDAGLRTVSRILSEAADKIGREINPHVMSIQEFQDRVKKHEHFVSQVYQSPRLMIIGKEDEFKGLVS